MTLKNGIRKLVVPVSKPWQNREGYSDPTAYEGMKPVDPGRCGAGKAPEHPDLCSEVHYPVGRV